MSCKIVDGVYYKSCEMCGEYFRTKKSHIKRRKTCSRNCSGERKKIFYKGNKNPNYGNRLEKNPMYKGSYITSHGYRALNRPDDKNANKYGYVLEHRMIMSNELGRPLSDEEIVHHIDGNKLNNRISNLEVMDRSSHSSLHSEKYVITRCEKTGRFTDLKNIGFGSSGY